jgi:glycosyltransferase involved in cell wall biosynthesis
MPAYNSAATLDLALDGLLSQDFSDFELIVSDNASTDATWNILLERARQDSRIRLIRQPVNIGANGNYSAVYKAAQGRYFKWASSNDWCAAGMLRRCIEVLESNPRASVATPRTRLFEKTPDDAIDYPDDIACVGPDAAERFIHLGMRLALNNAMNGVIRRSALERTRLIEHYPGADVVLMAHLALLGEVVLIDEPLFHRRMDRLTATRMMSEADVHRHHYPTPTWRSSLPSWRLSVGWLRVAWTGSDNWRDRRRAVDWALRNAWWHRADLWRNLHELRSLLSRR